MAPKRLRVDNYMLIKPEEVTYVELIRLLFSSRLKNISFIDCSKEEGEIDIDIWSRVVIMLSALLQKWLQRRRTPLAKLGNRIEYMLNLLTVNKGLLNLLKNFKSGKVVEPGPTESASVIGNLDTRVDLDEKIKSGDEKYFGALAMMASKLAYEHEPFLTNVVQNNWKMHLVRYYNFWNDYMNRGTTPVFVCQDSEEEAKLVVVAFKGTDPFSADNWCTDIDLSKHHLPDVGNIHKGFAKSIGFKYVTDDHLIADDDDDDDADPDLHPYTELVRLLKEDVLKKNPVAKFMVTGHSLGGALAALFMACLAIHGEVELLERLQGVYTFGQPRIGDAEFARYMTEQIAHYNINYKRYVYSFDIVPRIPFEGNHLDYKHFGKCLFFDSRYGGKVVEEVPDRNYFSWKWFLPKHANALYELGRAFVIPSQEGPEYKEGWAQILYRVFGLYIPGISAHGPQDYVNATRLGSVPVLAGPKESIKLLISSK